MGGGHAMSFTYHAGESTRDWIRLRIGDTTFTDQLLQDEDIDSITAFEGSRFAAAAACADAIAANYARQVDKQVGRLKISASQRAEHYQNLAKQLRSELSLHVAPYAGGISESDKETVTEDTDIVQPQFSIGMDDFPGSVPSTTDA
jgi:hypothetical protein